LILRLQEQLLHFVSRAASSRAAAVAGRTTEPRAVATYLSLSMWSGIQIVVTKLLYARGVWRFVA